MTQAKNYPPVTYPGFLEPESTSDLIRVGGPFDGGYVIPERCIAATDGLLSFGLSDDWTFERDFFGRKKLDILVYDPSVTKMFWVKKVLAGLIKGTIKLDLNRFKRGFRVFDYYRFFDGARVKHAKRLIGPSSATSDSVEDAIAKMPEGSQLFLKMDIEGWEYRVLDQIVANRARFSGMAIEFHDIDLHEERLKAFLDAVSDHFVNVHFHPNTHTIIRDDGYSVVIELTLMNRTLLQKDEALKTRDLPLPGIDAPNLPGDAEPQTVFA